MNFFRPQRSCGKVMFIDLSVILFTGRGVSGRHTPLGRHPLAWADPLGRHPLGRHSPPHLGRQTVPLGRHPMGRPPPRQTPQVDTSHGQTRPPPRRPLKWTVRILLECILVIKKFLPFTMLNTDIVHLN